MRFPKNMRRSGIEKWTKDGLKGSGLLGKGKIVHFTERLLASLREKGGETW